MKKITIERWFTFIFLCKLLLLSPVVMGQKERVSMRDYLSKIEEEFNIKFSYSNSLVKGKYIIKKCDKPQELQVYLKKLDNQFFISSKKVNDRYFILTEKKIDLGLYVYDERYKTPIPNIDVLVLNREEIFKTNNKGYVKIKEVTHRDSLHFIAIGYDELKIGVENLQKTKQQVYLTTSNILNEVTVLGKKRGLEVQPSLGFTVDYEKIKTEYAKTDVLESLQMFPGISNPNENAGELYIRGGNTGQNLILYDGIKVYQTSFFFGAVSVFNPNDIDTITVYKGNTDIEYGNHVSGVVAIQTKDEVPKRVRVEVGSDMLQYNALLKIPVSKKLGVTLSMKNKLGFETIVYDKFKDRFLQNTDYIISSNEPTEGKFDLSFSNITSKITYLPNNNNVLTFNLLTIDDKADVHRRINIDTHYRNRIEDESSSKNYGASFNWKYFLGKNKLIKTNVYLTSYDKYINELNEYIDDNEFEDYHCYNATRKNTLKEFGIKTLLKLGKIQNKNTFLFGYEFLNQKLDLDLDLDIRRSDNESYSLSPILFIKEKNINTNHSVFTNYTFNDGNSILDLGLRFNYNSFFKKGLLEPRLFYKKKLKSNLFLKLGIEFKQQSINSVLYDRFFWRVQPFNIWMLSSDYSNMISKQYSGGFIFKNRGFLFDAEYYSKTISGVLQIPLEHIEIHQGDMEVEGVDVLLKKRFSKKYTSTVSYHWGKATLHFDKINDGVAFPTEFDVSHDFRWIHNYLYKGINLNFTWLFRTGLINIRHNSDEDGNLIGIDRGYERAPNYHRFDFSANYNFPISEKITGSIGVSLQNLFDNKVLMTKTLENFTTNPNNNHSYDFYNQSYTPNITVQLKF